jgi:hypothetical protein
VCIDSRGTTIVQNLLVSEPLAGSQRTWAEHQPASPTVGLRQGNSLFMPEIAPSPADPLLSERLDILNDAGDFFAESIRPQVAQSFQVRRSFT